MPVGQEPLELFFGLTKNDMLAIAETITLGFFALVAISILTTLVIYALRDSRRDKENEVGLMAFVVGSFSFFPLFGIFFGLAGIIWGFINIKNRRGKFLAILSFAGVALSILLIAVPIAMLVASSGGQVDDTTVADKTKKDLNSLVRSIEFYKLINDRYPDSLDGFELAKNDDTGSTLDPDFIYEPVEQGQGYYLLWIGQDGKPFTSDDLLPDITKSDAKKIGLRFRRFP